MEGWNEGRQSSLLNEGDLGGGEVWEGGVGTARDEAAQAALQSEALDVEDKVLPKSEHMNMQESNHATHDVA